MGDILKGTAGGGPIEDGQSWESLALQAREIRPPATVAGGFLFTAKLSAVIGSKCPVYTPADSAGTCRAPTSISRPGVTGFTSWNAVRRTATTRKSATPRKKPFELWNWANPDPGGNVPA